MAACYLASKHLGTTGTAVQLLRSTLLLPRTESTKVAGETPLPARVYDNSAAAAAAACVVRAEVGSELAPAPRLLAASGHWSLLRPGSGGSAPAPAHLHFHFYYSLLHRYLKNVLLQAHPHSRCQPIRVIKRLHPGRVPREGGCRQWKLPCVPWPGSAAAAVAESHGGNFHSSPRTRAGRGEEWKHRRRGEREKASLFSVLCPPGPHCARGAGHRRQQAQHGPWGVIRIRHFGIIKQIRNSR